MKILMWLAIIVVAAPILWFLISALLAYIIPERITGKMLLKQEIKKYKVPYNHLPNAFYEECIEFADKTSKFSGYGSNINRKAEYVKTIEMLAQLYSLWIHEPKSQTFTEPDGSPNFYGKIFQKYALQ